MITALVLYLDPTYVSQRWHMFLMYQAVNVAFTGYNILLIKRTAWIYDVGCKHRPCVINFVPVCVLLVCELTAGSFWPATKQLSFPLLAS
jgi:hypothetical protein